ncbi:MAG: NADH-quinone oxidoreductase subunit M [Deltaproteobacteria bacterium]|jgi:NADH-quinone oxidoreductase subunit M|nr:NADH-quinone oxidoreductase subunit M [Deltaproteobacteria bacterium]
MEQYLLSAILFTPLIGALLIFVTPASQKTLIKTLASLTTLIVFSLILLATQSYTSNYLKSDIPALAGFDMRTFIEFEWITSFHIYYRLGVDGLSVVLLLLTGFLFLIANFIAFSIEKNLKAFFALYLILLCGVVGIFTSLDFFLFYIFWEVMLLPMYFLIGIWGGERKEYAAIKFFLYTFFGSILILIVILAFYFKMVSLGLSEFAFNIPELIARQPFADLAGKDSLIVLVLFWLLFIGFAVKMPIFPLHMWLPTAHVQAPTAISVILAGVLLKLGSYGLLRLNIPLFQEVVRLDWVILVLAILGVINIIYGALCALGQRDLKSLVAYSSISHMGYVLLGIATLTVIGTNGAIFQMVAHGLSSALLFAIVGVLYERTHHREIAQFGGLAGVMPIFFSLALIGFFSGLGLPALCGFVGEIMVLLGVYAYNRTLALIAIFGMLLTAGYLLWTLQRVFLGTKKIEYLNLKDCSNRELIYLVPLALACIIFGIFPNLLINIYSS